MTSSFDKYAVLPDLDTAQDIYETPNIDDSLFKNPPITSATTTDTVDLRPDDSTTTFPENSSSGIINAKLKPDQARSKFELAEVDATHANFSDRIVRHRNSYITSTRNSHHSAHGRRRTRPKRFVPGIYEEFDTDSSRSLSSDDVLNTENNSGPDAPFSLKSQRIRLNRRLAQLRRHIEHLKADVELYTLRSQQQATDTEQSHSEEGSENLINQVTLLSSALDQIYVSNPIFSADRTPVRTVTPKLSAEMNFDELLNEYRIAVEKLQHSRSRDPLEPKCNETQPTIIPTPKGESQVKKNTLESIDDSEEEINELLMRVGNFDGRLGQIEQCLGLGNKWFDDPTLMADDDRPLLPRLESLERQLSLLSSAPASIDVASQKIQALYNDAMLLSVGGKRLPVGSGKQHSEHVFMATGHHTSSGYNSSSVNKRESIPTTFSFQTNELLHGSQLHTHQRHNTTESTGHMSNLDTVEASIGASSPSILAMSDNQASQSGLNDLDGELERDFVADTAYIAKVNILYETLDKITRIAPTVSLVLERLRSLRYVHCAAGEAVSTWEEFNELLQRQVNEIASWNESLIKLQEKIPTTETVWKKNIDTICKWVKDLEVDVRKIEHVQHEQFTRGSG